MYSAKLYNFIMKISNYDLYLAEEILQCVFIKFGRQDVSYNC